MKRLGWNHTTDPQTASNGETPLRFSSPFDNPAENFYSVPFGMVSA